MQTGQNWPAYFGVAHLSRDRGGRSANGGASDSPAGSGLPAAGSMEKWC
jgi:hypothetical protein